MQFIIGVDDTDVDGSPGTGRVTRGLADHLEKLALGTSEGVTRHQLLLDPAIPYTSHNSANCLGMTSSTDIGELIEACLRYLSANAVDGADPAFCAAEKRAVTPQVQSFGERAKVDVLTADEAIATAATAGVTLRSVAGGPEGVIGALAAVGLRAEGNDGRYVDLPGIREIGGVTSVEELLSKTPVSAVIDAEGHPLASHEQIESHGWIRPSLSGGVPVLRVRRDKDNIKRWVPYERRSGNSQQRS